MKKKIAIFTILVLLLVAPALALSIRGTGTVHAGGQGKIYAQGTSFAEITSTHTTGRLEVNNILYPDNQLEIIGTHTFLGNTSRNSIYDVRDAQITYSGKNINVFINGEIGEFVGTGTGFVNMFCNRGAECWYYSTK